jgi:heme/copper-type cytochrome/quinol oxidase subunit 4
MIIDTSKILTYVKANPAAIVILLVLIIIQISLFLSWFMELPRVPSPCGIGVFVLRLISVFELMVVLFFGASLLIDKAEADHEKWKQSQK